MRECARRAADSGVTIGVQNHHDIACGFESLYDLVQEVDQPNCRAMFDAWAPALHGADLAAAAAKLAPLTVHTTIANYQMRPRYRYVPALGQLREADCLPSRRCRSTKASSITGHFSRRLDAGGFAGTVAYEMCSPLQGGGSADNLDRYATKFVSYMRALR